MLIGGAEGLDGEVFAALWAALRIALRAEMRRRGLWSAPPSYLGVYGWRSWEQDGESDALEELAGGCYTFIFVNRLRSLGAQPLVKPDVEGLVVLGIRHFLHELQRQHDPLGYRVFAVARAAVRLALERGELSVTGGDPRVRNDTVLAFGVAGPRGDRGDRGDRSDGGEAGDGAAAGEAGDGDGGRVVAAGAPEIELQALVRRWNDRLLPDLVTAPRRAQEEVAERLSRCLSDLRRHGIQSFRFKDLIDPLKSDVRSRWAAFLRQTGQLGGTLPAFDAAGQGGGPAVGRPDLDLEERTSFSALARGVAAAVERFETDARTRAYLAKLWAFLSARAAQGGDGDGGSGGAAADDPRGAARNASGEKALSHRKLARLLEIPRDRLPELHQTLGLLVQQCRAGSAGAPPVVIGHPAAPGKAAAPPAGGPEARTP
jgi:hypothetical protein